MNENLNLVKILDGCPVGTVFYSSIYGDVRFVCLNPGSVYPITMRTNKDVIVFFTRDGRADHNYDGECQLFPSKDQRDWSKLNVYWGKVRVERFDPVTFKPFDKVLTRDETRYGWNINFFGFIDESKKCRCSSSFWKQCIPYNDDTKHLLGTNDDCPEYYRWWEE